MVSSQFGCACRPISYLEAKRDMDLETEDGEIREASPRGAAQNCPHSNGKLCFGRVRVSSVCFKEDSLVPRLADEKRRSHSEKEDDRLAKRLKSDLSDSLRGSKEGDRKGRDTQVDRDKDRQSARDR